MASDIAFDSFLDLLRQSTLVSDDQLLALMGELKGEGPKPENSRELALELVKRGILTEWQSDMLLQGKHRGFRLGPHRILRPLGQGGMSKVFLAEHEVMHRRCAIKVLPHKYQEDADLLNRFRLEARAIGALDHPHIVRAYDFNTEIRYGKDISYLVMEYVEGLDLRLMVEEQGPLDFKKAADFISQAAEGLAHAHEAGFVHRDVKPANLLVDPNGVLKILDLGLARFTFEGEEAWQALDGEQSAVGTADYVAPEQVVDSRHVDGRADIYSLGLTFYFLLTARRPFPKATLPELLMAHKMEKFEPISKFRPDVPFELVALIDRMTAKSPTQRPQTAKEVAEKLKAWLHDMESGRGYSRISELMAAAMKAKQSQAKDAGPEKSKKFESSELGFASLEDEKNEKKGNAEPDKGQRPPLRAKNDRDSDTVVLAVARPLQPVARPKAQVDLLSELLSDDTLAGATSNPIMPIGSRRGRKSAWPWIGLAAAAIFLMVLFLWLLVHFMSAEKTGDRIPKEADKMTEDSPRPNASSKTQAPPAPESNPEKEKPSAPAAPPDHPSPQNPPPVVEEKPNPPQPDANPPPIQETPPQPTPVAPTPPDTPPPNPTPENKPPENKPPENNPAENNPAENNADSIEKEKLLANISEMAIQLKTNPPPDAEPAAASNPADPAGRPKKAESTGPSPGSIVLGYAKAVAARCDIAVVKNSKTVMEIDVKEATTGEKYVVEITVELKCPNSAGNIVSVWKQPQQLISVDPLAIPPKMLKQTFSNNTSKFFKKFEKDVRLARSKFKPS